MSSKRFLDNTGLSTFLSSLKTAYAGNATEAFSTFTVGQAGKLSTARTVTFATGDVTGSFSFDGSANVSNVALSVNNEDLSNHINDTTVHVTAAEKATWNATASITGTTVTVTTDDWSNNTCTKTVSGVTANNIIFVTPAPASTDNYALSNIKCTAQASNSLTFTCATIPTSSVVINVLIIK